MKLLELYLTIPPSINDYYGTNPKTLGKYIKTAGKEFRQIVNIIRFNLKIQKIVNTKIKMGVNWIFKDNRIQDIDNRLKCLYDALTYAQIIDDDRNIVEMGELTKQVDKTLTRHICKVILEKSTFEKIEYTIPDYLKVFL